VISIDGSGHIAESIGTSYATPLASSLLANLVAELSTHGEEAPIPLAKALTFHSALLREGVPDVERFRHLGIGNPYDLPDILHCRNDAATIIMQVPLTPKPDFVKSPFPIPPCLIHPERGLQCDLSMTLYYDPPVDATYDFEYCRCNVVASLGTIRMRNRKDKEPKEGFNGEVELVPVDMMKAYPTEEELVKHGYKWSPLKLYHHRFIRGPADKTWELRLEMLTRAGFFLETPVSVFLIVTLRSLKQGLPVYDEMVKEMAKLGWGASDLRVRSRERLTGH
jgi:serine protease AprX